MNKVGLIASLIIALALIGGLVYYYQSVEQTDLAEQPQELIEVSLRLPIPVVDTAFSPYYLAQDLGIFKKHGLAVSIEPGSAELPPTRMVGIGTDDFGVVGGPELLLSARAKELPLVGVLQVHKDSDFVVLLTLADSNIQTLQDLQGKPVGMFYGHVSTDVLRMTFNKAEVSVEEINVGFDYSQLITGRLAAQWSFRTTAGLNLPAKGTPVRIISPADYGIKTQGHVIVTNETMIAERPEVVQSFTDAVLEAIRYSLSNADASVEAATRRDPTFDASVGRKQVEIYNPAIERNEPIGWIATADMERTKEQMTSVGLLDPTFDVSTAFTTTFVAENSTSP